MTKLRRFFVLLIATLSCALLATGCESLTKDPNFHTWCGDQLCSWKLESGQIRKSPTWHKKDFGVELLDPEPGGRTVLSQTTSSTPRCLEFATIADVAAGAQVSVGVDFNHDGTIDYEQPIAATGFTEQKTQVTAPLRYDGMRFVITKKGTGRAVLAQMQVKASNGCTAPPLEMKALPLGTPCSLLNGGDECTSGTCCDGLCSECCGESPLVEPLPNDGGILHNPIVACANEGKCEAPINGVRGWFLTTVPRQCDPGKGKHVAGVECLLDGDCASGKCDNAIWNVDNLRIDGGACPTPPQKSVDCNISSVRGGRCK